VLIVALTLSDSSVWWRPWCDGRWEWSKLFCWRKTTPVPGKSFIEKKQGSVV